MEDLSISMGMKSMQSLEHLKMVLHGNAVNNDDTGEFKRRIFMGTFFVTLSVWWIQNTFRNYYTSIKRNGVPFETKAYFPVPFLKDLPMESIFKLIVVFIGLIMELIIIMGDNSEFARLVSGQQATLYLFFAFNAVLEIMKFYDFPVPNGIEPASGILAFGAEAIAFYYDQNERSLLYVTVHTFLFYAAITTIASIFLEIEYRDWVVPSLARGYFALTHGTWYIHVAIMLFPLDSKSTWQPNSHEDIMLATCFFMWHCGANLVLLLVWSIVVRKCMGISDDDTINQNGIVYEPLATSETIIVASDKTNGFDYHITQNGNNINKA